MPKEYIEIDVLEVVQPIGTFFIGALSAKDIVSISFADVRRPDGRDIERYIGTQRDLNEGRVAELEKYVTTTDACFPTSVILDISSEHVEFDPKRKKLKIEKSREVAKIIDGQHRIAGLENYNGADFNVNVTIFIDMDLEDQAMVFATINLKQTKVTKSLAYDLYEYSKNRSPQKTCHNIVKLLNFKDGSPFYKRVKILGKATGEGSELLTQATIVDRLLKLISRDPMIDKDHIKRGIPLKRAEPKEQYTMLLRNRFIDAKDAEIAKIIWNYYEAVSKRWSTAWNNLEKGQILPRTTGFAALLRTLPTVWEKQGFKNDGIPTVDQFKVYFDRISLDNVDFNSDRFKPGSSGEAALVEALKQT
jgi:DGQHR domain-containing protein